MTFDQINYFLMLASCLSYTKAASKLFISQSALSRSINSLEKELEIKLLTRNYHNVELTPAGKIVYREMNEVMENINEIFVKAREAEQKAGNFIIGVLDGQNVDPGVLYSLNKLANAFPGVHVELRRQRHSEFVSAAKRKQIDVIQTLISENTVLDEALDKIVIGMEPYYLVARENLPQWRDTLDMEILGSTRLLVQKDISPDVPDITRIVKSAFPEVKIQYTPDEGSRSLLLESGIGVTICNKNHIFLTASTRPLSTVELPELGSALITVIWNKNYDSELLQTFLRFLREYNSGEETR